MGLVGMFLGLLSIVALIRTGRKTLRGGYYSLPLDSGDGSPRFQANLYCFLRYVGVLWLSTRSVDTGCFSCLTLLRRLFLGTRYVPASWSIRRLRGCVSCHFEHHTTAAFTRGMSSLHNRARIVVVGRRRCRRSTGRALLLDVMCFRPRDRDSALGAAARTRLGFGLYLAATRGCCSWTARSGRNPEAVVGGRYARRRSSCSWAASTS